MVLFKANRIKKLNGCWELSQVVCYGGETQPFPSSWEIQGTNLGSLGRGERMLIFLPHQRSSQKDAEVSLPSRSIYLLYFIFDSFFCLYVCICRYKHGCLCVEINWGVGPPLPPCLLFTTLADPKALGLFLPVSPLP